MTNEIYNNRQGDSRAWIEVTKGRKYITLQYRTIMQGDHDVTITYNKGDEAELLKTLADPRFCIEAITGHGWGPEPIKIVKHEAVK